MFTTKKQVDQHVKTSLAKLRNDNEKRLRGFIIAKMYFKISEYTSAQHYVSGYLTANETSPQAHRLLGDCYLKLKQTEKALNSYQRALQLDPKQTDLIIEACSLLLTADVEILRTKAKYWYEMATSERVEHEAVFTLKLKMLTKDKNKDQKQAEDLIRREIGNRPRDVSPRIQLVNFFISKNRIVDAFQYIHETEMKSRCLLINSLDWYNVVSKALQLYRSSVDKPNEMMLAKNWDFWSLTLSSVERQLNLNLAVEHSLSNQQMSNLTECQNLLFELDQLLNIISNSAFPVRPELTAQMLLHFKGQFALHVASYLFKRERTVNNNQWWTTTTNSLPMLLFAFHTGIADIEEPWLRHSSESVQELVRHWQKQAAFRCSQAGRSLLSCIKNDESPALFANEEDLLNSARKSCASNGWRKNLFRYLFTNGDHSSKISASFLVTCNSFEEPIFEVPVDLRLEMYEKIVEPAQSESLQQLVYLYLKNEKLSECFFSTVDGLEFSTNNLHNCSANTLNKLDMEAFFIATLMQTKSVLFEDRLNAVESRRPLILPYANMVKNLCTEDQAKWWSLAFKAARNSNVEDKELISDGIGVIRLGNSKMELMITLQVAETLQRKTQNLLTSEFNRKAYEQRTLTLYQSAVHEIKNHNFTGLVEKKKLFKFHSKTSVLHSAEFNRLSDLAVTYLAEYYFKKGDFDACISQLTGVNLSTATYYLAEAHKKLGEANLSDAHIKSMNQGQASDLNISHSFDYDHNASNLSRSRREEPAQRADGNVLDQVMNLTCLVQQLSLQNTMLQTELMDIKKMIQKKDTPPPLNDSLYRLEEQHRLMQQHQSPQMDYFNSRYANYFPLPYQAYQPPPPFPSHMRPTTPLYGQETGINAMNQSTPQNRGLYDPVSQLNLPPQMIQPNPQQLYYPPQQQLPLIQGGPTGQLNANVIEQAIANTSFLKNNWNAPYAGNNEPVEKAAPVNVVITSSDPLPAHTTITSSQPLLSVTIPPQHIKNYFGQEANNFPTTITSSLVNEPGSDDQDLTNISGDETATEEDDYDESADYEQVTPEIQDSSIPIQASIVDIIYFSGHGKLFRFAEKEWKERGVGEVKIFKTINDSNMRLTMHRDDTKTICANHLITGDMKLDPMPKQQSSFVWAASDFSSGVSVTEKFVVKFKGIEQANGFKAAFDRAVKEAMTSAKPPTQPNMLSKSEKIIFNATPTDPPPSQPQVAPPLELPKTSFTFGMNNLNKPAEPKIIDSTAKPNPFANFTFGAASGVSPFGSQPVVAQAEEKPFSSIFSNLPKPTTDATNSFLNLSSSKPAENLNRSTDPTDGDGDDYVPTAQFKPVIALPSLIDVKTGEEDEIIAFEHRSKLLRYDTVNKEWKERGLGNIKILVRKDDPNKARLLMRREQVLKLACNQRLLKDQVFKKMPNSETALTWYAQDYAENELKNEMFAIRFKSSDICKAFHNAVLEVQSKMGDNLTTSTVPEPAKNTEEKKQGFGDLFKPKAGSWDCKACYITNKSDVLHCVACETPKDDTVPKKENSKPKGIDLGPMTNKFSFGIPAAIPTAPVTTIQPAKNPPTGFGDAFKPSAGSWNCKDCYTSNNPESFKCIACESPKDGTTVPKPIAASDYCFGTQPPATNTATTSSFNFGNMSTISTSITGTTSPFSFGFGSKSAEPTAPGNPVVSFFEKPAEPKPEPKKKEKDGFSLDQPNSTFNFVFKPKSPGKVRSPLKVANGGDDEHTEDEESNIEEENNTYFTPVIALPEKVDAKTGEEDETVLYSHRAKLFRFTEGDWKERGLGDVKILKHNQTGKLRMVMRRDQILKICLNHVLDEDVEYKVKDNKSWLFVVNDFSEGILELNQFCLRFKTPEIIEEFKAAVDSAVKGLGGAVEKAEAESTTIDDLTDEEKKLIKELRLPNEFFVYKSCTDCAGCRGCREEELVFPSGDQKANDIEIPLHLPPLKGPVKKIEAANIKSVFGSFTPQFGTSTTNSVTTTHNLFGQMPVFGAKTAETQPISSVFGGASNFSFTKSFVNNETTNSMFGSAVAPKADPVDPTGTAVTPPPSNLFSGQNSSPNNSFFGSNSFGNASTGTIFGGGSANDSSKTLLFGSMTGGANMFGGNASTVSNNSSGSLFGGSGALGSFSFNSALSASVVEENKENEKANVPADEPKEETFKSLSGITFKGTSSSASQPEIGRDIFKVDPTMSFASLASQSNEQPAFAKKNEAPGGFFGLSNTQDFRHFDGGFKNTNGTNKDGDTSTGSAHEDGQYDPHYEPIIALPDEVAVSTGEEDEEKLFGERGCLYRYDSDLKEWKERGIGEFKVLHHPGKGTYRFVLRREQIFKLVLNHMITADFLFNPLDKSGKSYCWAAMNHAEGPPQLEKLAVRFKNPDIAGRFEKIVRSSIDLQKKPED